MEKISSKDSLIRNLRALMQRDKLSEAALGKRAKIAQKTINKIMNGKSSPTLKTVDALATAFGITGWHLIMGNLPDEMLTDRSIERLCASYFHAPQKIRDYIYHVAEREAEYNTKVPER